MIVDFQLLNEDMLTIGKARLDLPTEDVDAVRLGLKATGQAYTQCRWLKYQLYWNNNGAHECYGKMLIEPCQKDS